MNGDCWFPLRKFGLFLEVNPIYLRELSPPILCDTGSRTGKEAHGPCFFFRERSGSILKLVLDPYSYQLCSTYSSDPNTMGSEDVSHVPRALNLYSLSSPLSRAL